MNENALSGPVTRFECSIKRAPNDRWWYAYVSEKSTLIEHSTICMTRWGAKLAIWWTIHQWRRNPSRFTGVSETWEV